MLIRIRRAAEPYQVNAESTSAYQDVEISDEAFSVNLRENSLSVFNSFTVPVLLGSILLNDYVFKRMELEDRTQFSRQYEDGLFELLVTLSGDTDNFDIGALLGLLTQFVQNLIGPNGIDIPSALITITSLLSGLLAGGRNFGIVLGEYIGLTIEGLSGGRGAVQNGKFFGNLIGTVVAELSAFNTWPPKGSSKEH